MNISEYKHTLDAARAGAELQGWICDWYPINRSLTGDGVREQLRRLAGIAPIEIHEVPT
ncbi:MAG: DUF4910 domain-containing protein, partial [Candidatus Hydrogenedentes bacterium]|nr:DUF4910 domain-containing protein [Candidatus Hydrogenedentota bacterium]